MNDCVFCKIVKGELPCYKIDEDKDTITILSIAPILEGHTLVIPKKHYKNILEMPNETMNTVLDGIKKVSKLLQKKLGSEGFNISNNINEVAGQTIFHVHWHVIPRKKNDGLISWPETHPNKEAMEKTLKKIK